MRFRFKLVVEKQIALLYLAITIIVTLGGAFKTHLPYFKSLGVPLLMPYLSQMYYYQSRYELNRMGRKFPSDTFNIIVQVTLGLSWIADMFFLIKHQGDHYYYLGLITFLFAHLGYIYLFAVDCTYPQKLEFDFWDEMKINTFYSGGCVFLLSYLFPYMGNLGKPILIYGVSVFGMCRITWIRYGRVKTLSFLYVMVGANFFLASDVLVMLNKFGGIYFLHMEQIVLFTYCVGQFIIICGLIEGNKKGKSKNE